MGFDDGNNFFRPASTKNKVVRAKSSGFGDMICEVSNAIQRGEDCDILRFKHIGGTEDFIKLTGTDLKINMIVDNDKFEDLRSKAWDMESFCEVSGREKLPFYTESNYIQLDKSKFIPVDGLPDKYITSQWVGNAKRCLIRPEQRKQIEDQYGLPVINHQQLLAIKDMRQLAYVCANAEYHVGTDSGPAHFAMCILPKDRVHVHIRKGTLTAQTSAQLRNGYRVFEV